MLFEKLFSYHYFNLDIWFYSLRIYVYRSSESLNLSNNPLGITKLTNLLKKRKVKHRSSESQIPDLDSPETRSVSVIKPFQTYCKQTSLHGWKYVAFSKGTKFERICWLILLLCALLIASNLVYRYVKNLKCIIYFIQSTRCAKGKPSLRMWF